MNEDSDRTPSEIARDARRDHDADAQSKALMRTGLLKNLILMRSADITRDPTDQKRKKRRKKQ